MCRSSSCSGSHEKVFSSSNTFKCSVCDAKWKYDSSSGFIIPEHNRYTKNQDLGLELDFSGSLSGW
jgi:hypothetical protein